MRVKQLMTGQVESCRSSQSLSDAARIMWERDCGFVPVTAEDGPALMGVITDRDICMATFTQGRAPGDIAIGSVMTRELHTCRPTDDIATAADLMRKAQVHRLPVVDARGDLLGVISLADIARESAQEARAGSAEVSASEVGRTVEAIRQPRAVAQA
jgi:CBS domain-containing protein